MRVVTRWGRTVYQLAITTQQDVKCIYMVKAASCSREAWWAHWAGETAQGADVSEHIGHWEQALERVGHWKQALQRLQRSSKLLQRVLVNVQGCQAVGCLSQSVPQCSVNVLVGFGHLQKLLGNCDHRVGLQPLNGSLTLVTVYGAIKASPRTFARYESSPQEGS